MELGALSRAPVLPLRQETGDTDGTTFPIEVELRRKVDPDDLHGFEVYLELQGAPQGILVTRDHDAWRSKERNFCFPS